MLRLVINVEPRIAITSVQPAKIEKALDSDGDSLLEPKPDRKGNRIDEDEDDVARPIVPNVTWAELRRSNLTAKSIHVIRGTIPITAILVRRPITLTNQVANAAGTEVPVGFEKVKIVGTKSSDGQDLEVELRIIFDKIPDGEWSFRTDWGSRVQLLDDLGNSFAGGESVVENLPRHSNVRIRFVPPKNKRIGPPTRLVFDQLIIHQFEIPFEFRDIPMP